MSPSVYHGDDRDHQYAVTQRPSCRVTGPCRARSMSWSHEAHYGMQTGRQLLKRSRTSKYTYRFRRMKTHIHSASAADSQSFASGRVVLLGLAFFFASSTLTIGLLYYFSQVDHGFTTAQNSHRYAWLYGPTAGKAKIHRVRQQLTSNSCDLDRRDLARDRS
jgi:hypothetical protein